MEKNMSAQLTAKHLIAGSDAHNADIAYIKRVVTTLQGIVNLYAYSMSEESVQVTITAGLDVETLGFLIQKDPMKDRVEILFVRVLQGSCRTTKWEDMTWSPKMPHGSIPRDRVADFAANLDKLVEAVALVVPESVELLQFFCDRGAASLSDE